jgi:hypothetical protein
MVGGVVLYLGGPLALRARVACYRAAEDGRATEPADAVSAHAGDARCRGACGQGSVHLQPPG